MRYPKKFTSALQLREYMKYHLFHEFPTLYWGLSGIADDGWFWFERYKNGDMYADIKYLEYWGA